MAEKTGCADEQKTRKEKILVDANQRKEQKTDCGEEKRNERTGEMTPFCNHRAREQTGAANGDCCDCIKLVEKLKIEA